MQPNLPSRRRWIVGALTSGWAGCSVGQEVKPTPPRAAPIESITLERFGHAITAPWYAVTFRRGGQVTYAGRSNVARIGTFQADIGAHDFDRLAELSERIGFSQLRDEYPLVPDAQGAKLTVQTSGGGKTVHDSWGSPSPVELWGLQMAIDGLIAGIDAAAWTKTENRMTVGEVAGVAQAR